MREVTGYEDLHGRPILEGDIVRSHAGEIHLIEEISEGWYPLSFFDHADLATVEVIGSSYTEWGHRLLADQGLLCEEAEEPYDGDYEQTLDVRRREAIAELSAMILEHYPTATFNVSPDPDEPDITLLWATIDVDDHGQVLDLVSERALQLQVDEDVPVYVVPIRPPRSSRQTLSEYPWPSEDNAAGTTPV
jgi:hypothetical protein